MKYIGIYRVILLATCVIFCTSSKRKIKVDQKNYAWKGYYKISDQTVDLKRYRSPNTRPDQDSNTLVIVCAGGGGARASAFTIGVMLELEKIKLQTGALRKQQNVLNAIDYFSTVSGGGWGAATYIAYRYQQNKYGPLRYPSYNSYEDQLAYYADCRYAHYQLRYFLESIF